MSGIASHNNTKDSLSQNQTNQDSTTQHNTDSLILNPNNAQEYFEYSKQRQQQKDRGAIPEGTYYIDISQSTDNTQSGIRTYDNTWYSLSRNKEGAKQWGKYNIPIYTDKDCTNTRASTTQRENFYIHGGESYGDNGGIDLASNMKDFYKSINKIAGCIDSIPLKVSYQKRIIIIIERFRQTTESTISRMHIYIDTKRVDSHGNIIGAQTKNYEYYNPKNLPEDNPYAYILERSGPDSIGGELRLRVPEGRYLVEWYNEKNAQAFLKESLNLKNDFVGLGRHILIHDGASPKNSAGCLLIKAQLQRDSDNNIVDNILKKEPYKKKAFTNHINNEFKTLLFGANNNKSLKDTLTHIEVRVENRFEEVEERGKGLEVGYEERKSEIDLRGKRTPNGGVVEWISQFDNGGGTACFDTCKKILVNSGLSSNSASPITRFQVAKENKKLLQSTNQSEYLVIDVQTAKDGIAYLDSELESGYPVLVGVDYEFDRKIKLKNGKIDYLNKTDYTTDHYIVIVGRRYDEKNLYYLFYDVGTNSINEKQYKAGSNDNNRLFLQNDYSLRGQSQIPSKHFYVVTQIRRNIR